MTIRLAIGFVVALLLAIPAAAGTYIIPVYSRPDGQMSQSWQSHVTLTNPHESAVVVQVKSVFPYGSEGRCGTTVPWNISPHASTELFLYCSGAVAVEIVTDQTVGITADVSLFVRQTATTLREVSRESVAVPGAWLGPGIDYFIPEVEVNAYTRSNLFIVNPSSEVLRVDLQRSSDFPMPTRNVNVSPRSALALPLEYDPTTCLNGGDVLNEGCATPLRVRGSGPFFAAVSVVDNSSNMASFRIPVE